MYPHLPCFVHSGNESDTLTSSLSQSRVPLGLFVTLLVQFTLLLVERAIYLRSSLRAKFWLQVIQVVGIHVFFFVAWPAQRSPPRPLYEGGSSDRLLAAGYAVKALAFYVTARQLRCGYPPFVKRQSLTSDASYSGWLRYIIYRSVPFLFEMKTVLDWACTDSPLTLYDWLKLEDINANLFLIECDLQVRLIRALWYLSRGCWVSCREIT